MLRLNNLGEAVICHLEELVPGEDPSTKPNKCSDQHYFSSPGCWGRTLPVWRLAGTSEKCGPGPELLSGSPTSQGACSSRRQASGATAAGRPEAGERPRTPAAHSWPAGARSPPRTCSRSNTLDKKHLKDKVVAGPLHTVQSPPSEQRACWWVSLLLPGHWVVGRKQQPSESGPARWGTSPGPDGTKDGSRVCS